MVCLTQWPGECWPVPSSGALPTDGVLRPGFASVVAEQRPALVTLTLAHQEGDGFRRQVDGPADTLVRRLVFGQAHQVRIGVKVLGSDRRLYWFSENWKFAF
jgi:hypothetical protein